MLKEEPDAEEIKEKNKALADGFDIGTIIDKDTWKDWYGGYNEEVRYLLFRYEEHLARKSGATMNDSQWAKVWAADPARSIEHVMPQSSGQSYVHSLGNLTMLPPGVNSSLKDRSPSDKAATYVQCGMQSTLEIGHDIQNGLKWGKKAVLARASKIEKFVRKEWGD